MRRLTVFLYGALTILLAAFLLGACNGDEDEIVPPPDIHFSEFGATISAWGSSSFVVRYDNSLWAWGGNYGYEPVKIMENVVGLSGYIALKEDGSLWALGGDEPEKIVVDMDDIIYISSSGSHTMAIRADGSLWGWGLNRHGQLGAGVVTTPAQGEVIYEPMWVMDDVASVSVGDRHTAAIKTDGSLWTWGNNEYWQLGDDGPADGSWPTNRGRPVHIMDDVVAVSAGRDFTVALLGDGHLYGWGLSSSGQLGNGQSGWLPLPNPALERNPIRMLVDVAYVSVGDGHVMAIRTDNSLWGWGLGSTNNLRPARIMDNVAAVSAGGSHTIAVTEDGSLWTWGRNEAGQLGNGTSTHRHSPTKIMDDVARISVSDSVGMGHITVIQTDGNLWGWGYNGWGEIGIGAPAESGEIISEPVKIMDDIASVSIVRIDIHPDHSRHTFVIKNDGSLYGWGVGPIGSGEWVDTWMDRRYPAKIMEDVVAVSSSISQALAIQVDGSLWAWGGNFWGEIGDGTREYRHLPVRIMENAIAVSATDSQNSFALLVDGSLWAWGRDFRSVPNRIMDGISENSIIWQLILETGHFEGQWKDGITDDMVYISVGRSHVMAIKEDGSLWGWGLFGGGARERQYDPIKIMDDVIYVVAGVSNTLAITTDNSLWGWGSNFWGQLGDDVEEFQSAPVKLMEGVASVFSTDRNTFAITTDNSLWVWGGNSWGQFGDGTHTHQMHPYPEKIMEGVRIP